MKFIEPNPNYLNKKSLYQYSLLDDNNGGISDKDLVPLIMNAILSYLFTIIVSIKVICKMSRSYIILLN
jgi:hypothetical protein